MNTRPNDNPDEKLTEALRWLLRLFLDALEERLTGGRGLERFGLRLRVAFPGTKPPLRP